MQESIISRQSVMAKLNEIKSNVLKQKKFSIKIYRHSIRFNLRLQICKIRYNSWNQSILQCVMSVGNKLFKNVIQSPKYSFKHYKSSF